MNREDFLVICADGTGEQVIKAIKSGANPNEIFFPAPGVKKNALDIAVIMNNIDAAMALLANGANPDVRDQKGRTALMYAVLISSEMVKTLLDGGADPNVKDLKGRTALGMAVAGHDMSIERFIYVMIQIRGFKAQCWEDLLFAALMSAIYSRQEQLATVRELLSHEADITICDDHGMNAAAYAMMSNDDEIFAMLTGIN
ncbi:MAG: ankyrin repeat domain-containing protein [Synergistaceae bacterium]|nr:ankyrin repeat domain-containing protein [Synergistaceae bacterium]